MLVRRQAIKEVELMDEAFFIYSEEADWYYRSKKAGWKNLFWTGAKIIHPDGGSKSSKQVNIKMEVQKVKSLLIFTRKNYGYLQYLLCWLIIFITSLVKLLVCLLVMVVKPSKMFQRIRKYIGICQYCLTGKYADLPS